MGTLPNLENMYLTNNSLTGQVSPWLQTTTSNFDISYNNFTGEARGTCQTRNLNKIASYPAVEDDSVDWCFKRNLQCSRKPSNYNVFINCGGRRLSFGGENYEEDSDDMGPSSFYSNDRWACSSTGNFMGSNNVNYIAESWTNRSDDESIYSTVRLAPLSLKYYGHCFRQGSYTVRLHFAEIQLTADPANNVRGRRIFDVYIQGERVLSNFDIAKEAGGIGKRFNFSKPDVNVTGSTLEIHLYWAGKGTVSLPVIRTYGPLISAISVTPNFDVSTEQSAGTIAGIVVGAFVAVLLFLALLWKLRYLGAKYLKNKDVDQISNVESLQLKLTTVAAATENFSEANKLGEGGFGPVYKGKLSDGQEIAVKRLSRNSDQGVAEFKNEILLLAKLQHRNLVRLLGFCSEGEEKLLIYEFVINASLDQFIFDPIKRTQLDWGKRYNIIGGIARGLLYLHDDSHARIIHRDLKASNILLNDQMNPKISDFGTARLFMMDQTHANTRRITGTFGYMPPEYVIHGHFSVKSDVFSFGVLVLELISGKKNTSLFETECAEDLLCYAWRRWREGTALELLDPALRDHYNENEVTRCIHIGLMCVQEEVAKRPTMATVDLMLSSYSVNLALPSPPPRSGSFTISASMPHSNNEVSVTELSAR